MDRREKQRRFHQAIIDMLYPPPPHPHHQEEEEEDPTTTASVLDANLIKDPDNYDGTSSSSDDKDEEGGPGPGSHKLTRAQRKRLRKTKLKESASSAPQRRKVIGPLLPSASAVSNPDGEDRPEGVRQNAPENQSQNITPDPEGCNAQKEGKLKRRRMAKKLAREKSKN